MKTRSIGLLLAIFAPLIWMPNAKTQDLNWPEEIANKIEAILEVKREAMRFPGMRSPLSDGIGIFGRRVEPLMDELAGLVTDPALVAELEKAEATDIRPKIALWALDRKERPEEYARFAEWYVNRPAYGEDAVEYFSRPHMKPERLADADPFAGPINPAGLVPRVGTWRPHEIAEEERIEENRHIMEYHFFMPPTGREFDNDIYRSNFLTAISELGNIQDSLCIFECESELLSIHEDHRGKKYVNTESLAAFFRAPSDPSFRGLAKWFSERDLRDYITSMFESAWRLRWLFSDREDAERHHTEWIILANRNWTEPHEREFAEWLKTVPAPEPPLSIP